MTGLIIFWFPLERQKPSFRLRCRLYEEKLMFRRLGSSEFRNVPHALFRAEKKIGTLRSQKGSGGENLA